MVKYEKLTGGNALELFSKENKSAIDLVHLAFLIKYTVDPTTTLEQMENISNEEFTALMNSISGEKKE